MADYPNTVKSFTDLVDGTDYVEATNVNTAYDEVEAIQTLIGALGSTQANTDSLKNLLKDYRRLAQVHYKSAADLYVRAGELTITDASGNVRFRRNTSDTTVDWTDIDTGAEANSTQYYVYAVADASATTFTVLISTNATTPTGATFYRKIGTFYNNSSGDIDRHSIYGDTLKRSQLITGTYTGDGNATLDVAVSGLRSTDVIKKVVIHRQTTSQATPIWKTDQDGTKAWVNPSGGTGNVYADDHIISMTDGTGFQVGDGTGTANYANVNTVVYTYEVHVEVED